MKVTSSSQSSTPLYIDHQVASEGDALTLGGISQTPSYLEGKGKEAVQVTVVILMVTLMVMMMVIIVTPTVQAVFKKQIDVFVEEGLDFVLCEVKL